MNWTGKLRFSLFRLWKVSLKDKLREMKSLTFSCANCSNLPVLFTDPNLKYYLILAIFHRLTVRSRSSFSIAWRYIRPYNASSAAFLICGHNFKSSNFINLKWTQRNNNSRPAQSLDILQIKFRIKDALRFCTRLDTTEHVEIIAIVILLSISYLQTLSSLRMEDISTLKWPRCLCCYVEIFPFFTLR